ncbi:MAG TPA: alpha-ketoglutarate-dependent dioxygenase AlkB [Sunxiuqinia sp.]|nr:alpha-ketoglutarate-dependent dioxygenase AlkB [Sunxiuqinia sp.]
MNLFSELTDPTINILPRDGIVNYFGPLLPLNEATDYYKKLMSTIAWKNDEVILYGKRIITKREVAWYGDRDFSYTYSNISRPALPWTKELLELKVLVEKKLNESFNSCLLNLYHSGEEGMSWHSDDEKELVPHGSIASLSFGAERKFSFKHKQTKQEVEQVLEHGSLLVMKAKTQIHWLHSLRKTKKVREPRINLTFRKFVE